MSHYTEENAKIYKWQEVEFGTLVSPFGEISFSNYHQDKNEHWDVKLINKDKIILTDVKGMKRTNHSDKEPNENIHWIEIHNINGNNGWLYGKADCFAFEMKEQYVIVDKEPLQNFIKEKCKDKIYCDTPELYKLCRSKKRPDRKDIIVLVETKELIRMARRIVPKEDNEKLVYKTAELFNIDIKK